MSRCLARRGATTTAIGYLDLAIAAGDKTIWRYPMALLHNSANGKFTAMTNSVLCQRLESATSLAWVDYDGDGDWGPGRNVSDPPAPAFAMISGFLNPRNPPTRSNAGRGVRQGLAWGDYDNDGDLDAYATRPGKTGVLCQKRWGRGHFVALDGPTVRPLAVDSRCSPPGAIPCMMPCTRGTTHYVGRAVREVLLAFARKLFLAMIEEGLVPMPLPKGSTTTGSKTDYGHAENWRGLVL